LQRNPRFETALESADDEEVEAMLREVGRLPRRPGRAAAARAGSHRIDTSIIGWKRCPGDARDRRHNAVTYEQVTIKSPKASDAEQSERR